MKIYKNANNFESKNELRHKCTNKWLTSALPDKVFFSTDDTVFFCNAALCIVNGFSSNHLCTFSIHEPHNDCCFQPIDCCNVYNVNKCINSTSLFCQSAFEW